MVFLLELGLALLLAAALGLLAHRFRQPLVLAYIAAGIILGPAVLNEISSPEFLDTFARLGVAFLLFLVGMSLKPSAMKEMGRSAFLAGAGQVIITLILGFLLALSLGFPSIQALYLALAFSFSSTIIVVKLLADRGELAHLSSRLVIGVLIVQDIVALGALILLNNISGPLTAPFIVAVLIKAAIVGGIAVAIYKFVARRAFAALSSSQELLLLTAVTWCFLMMGIAFAFGFSIEIGALLAGLALSSIPFTSEIESKVKPLRDFFLIIFFIFLGTRMGAPVGMILPFIAFSVFVIAIKPLVVLVLLGLLRYRKRTSFLAASALGQTSEFSLIIATLGLSLGHLTPEVVTLLAGVSLLSFATSTYSIHHSARLFSVLSRYLTPFERRHTRESLLPVLRHVDTVLLGCHTMGYSILHHLKGKVLVIDFNPSVVSFLSAKKIPALLADALEPDTLRHLRAIHPKIIVSTLPLPEHNHLLLRQLSATNAKLILTAGTAEEAAALYKKGADFVLVPHLLGGKKASQILEEFLNRPASLRSHKSRHGRELNVFLHFLNTLRQ